MNLKPKGWTRAMQSVVGAHIPLWRARNTSSVHHFSLVVHENLVTQSHQDSGEAERCILWLEAICCAQTSIRDRRLDVGGNAVVHGIRAVGKGGGHNGRETRRSPITRGLVQSKGNHVSVLKKGSRRLISTVFAHRKGFLQKSLD